MRIEDLNVTISSYFRGERHEMFAILACSLILICASGLLYVLARDGFAKGFAVAVLVSALGLSSIAVSLLRRDPPHEVALLASLQGPEAQQALEQESARIAAFVPYYPSYRYAALALALIAGIAVLLIDAGWVKGAAAGVFLLAAAQFTIDHYSERRARDYADKLGSAAAEGVDQAAQHVR